MTFTYKVLPARRRNIQALSNIKGFSRTHRTITRKWNKDRRKNIADRRKSVREGIIVRISLGKDRRVQGDRRTRGNLSFKI